MTGQLAFPGFGADVDPTDRLLFALFPEGGAAEQIAQLGHGLRGRHGLNGKPLATERFHVTLHHLGDYVGLPNGVATAAREAAGQVAAAPFEVVFDRAASFASRPGNNPFVLQGGEALGPLRAFQQSLGEALKRVGLGKWVKAYTPHVTLLYDNVVVEEQPVEPVRWTVSEFVLIHSLLGRTQHIALGRWPLNA